MLFTGNSVCDIELEFATSKYCVRRLLPIAPWRGQDVAAKGRASKLASMFAWSN
ncbi:hypothetical protein [Rhizobacter sp. Root1221]|uniref:hypothetical protein n=1 Tax=Rhizobacter sp. Root1221 TaxID=1736433 RepID=UPI000A711DAC|nr:hypothetical protein [Rhizobacter sp. Root1221]